MRADSVAKLTEALTTPGTLFSAFSTRPTQDAQVMPPTEMSMLHISGLVLDGVSGLMSVMQWDH
jgi:hypothetical protein